MPATIHHPPSLINAYLGEKVYAHFNGAFTIPFFPTNPTDIAALTETFPQANGHFAVYDRMFRMNRKNFPHIYAEQLMYYFYAFETDAVSNIIEISQKVHDYLNQLDESAQDINKWIRDNKDKTADLSLPLYFHTFKTYQLQETRDIIDFGTARTYAGNKIILDYDWHKG